MIPVYSEDELQMWLEAQPYELARFGPLNLLCQRMTKEIPEIVLIYFYAKNNIEIGEWIYFFDNGKIVRMGDKLKQPQHDSDKDILLIRTKSDGSTIEITRREIKIASGEVETLLKPEYPIFTGAQ